MTTGSINANAWKHCEPRHLGSYTRRPALHAPLRQRPSPKRKTQTRKSQEKSASETDHGLVQQRIASTLRTRSQRSFQVTPTRACSGLSLEVRQRGSARRYRDRPRLRVAAPSRCVFRKHQLAVRRRPNSQAGRPRYDRRTLTNLVSHSYITCFFKIETWPLLRGAGIGTCRCRG